MVKACIPRDKILRIYSQHYFIIMIPTSFKIKTSMKQRDQLFFYKNKMTTSKLLKIPPFLVGIYNELAQYGASICVHAHMQVRMSICLYLPRRSKHARPPCSSETYATSICLLTSLLFCSQGITWAIVLGFPLCLADAFVPQCFYQFTGSSGMTGVLHFLPLQSLTSSHTQAQGTNYFQQWIK